MTFYDKLLQVPLLNLSVKSIDWVVRSTPLGVVDPARAWRGLTGRPRNLAYVSIWAVVFLLMSTSQGVGDSHRGQWLPFWQHACGQDRPGACRHLSQMYATYCRAGSPWSCRELESMDLDRVTGRRSYLPATQTAFSTDGRRSGRSLPPIEELPIVLRGSKGPITERDPSKLWARACAQGWADLCGRAER